MRFTPRTLVQLGDLICGNLGHDNPTEGQEPRYFSYRSSKFITEFFDDLDMPYVMARLVRRGLQESSSNY